MSEQPRRPGGGGAEGDKQSQKKQEEKKTALKDIYIYANRSDFLPVSNNELLLLY